MRGKGVVIGVFVGIVFGLLFRKPAIAIALGLLVAYLMYRNDRAMTTSNDKPPLFSSWRAWYIAVIAFLVIEIIVFAWITQQFS